MRKVQVLVEVEVTDDHPLTEHELAHMIKRKLGSFKNGGEPLSGSIFLEKYASDHRYAFRKFSVKEFRRVKEYMPGGTRYKK